MAHTVYKPKQQTSIDGVSKKIECKNNILYAVLIDDPKDARSNVKNKDIKKQLNVALEEKLDEIYLYKCQNIKVYETIFNYCINNKIILSSINIQLIFDHRLPVIYKYIKQYLMTNELCVDLKKLAIQTLQTKKEGMDTTQIILEDILDIISSSNILKSNIECLELNGFYIDPTIKTKLKALVYLDKYLNDNATRNALKILDLRNIILRNGKHTFQLTKLLLSVKKTCNINELYIGGQDAFNKNGIETLSEFIKNNNSLTTLGIEFLYSTLFSKGDKISVSSFIANAFGNNDKLKDLQLYHIRPIMLKWVGEIFNIRAKNCNIESLYIHQIGEDSGAGDYSHLVSGALVNLLKCFKSLKILRLKLGLYPGLKDIDQLSSIINGCVYLNCLEYNCPYKVGKSKSELNTMMKMVYKGIKSKNENNIIKNERDTIIKILDEYVYRSRQISILILSFCDLSFAFNTGLLVFTSNLFNKMDKNNKIRKDIIKLLSVNWAKLPNNGRGKQYFDDNYQKYRNKLIMLNKRISSKKVV